MRFTSRVNEENMSSVRKRLRRNTFIHSEFDPDLSVSLAAPIMKKIFKLKDTSYDDVADKGSMYFMDYIINDLPKAELKKL